MICRTRYYLDVHIVVVDEWGVECMGYVVCMGKKINSYRALVEKPEGNRPP
jgi:hypothetical protein